MNSESPAFAGSKTLLRLAGILQLKLTLSMCICGCGVGSENEEERVVRVCVVCVWGGDVFCDWGKLAEKRYTTALLLSHCSMSREDLKISGQTPDSAAALPILLHSVMMLSKAKP